MNRRVLLTGGGVVVAAGTGAAWLGLRGMGSMREYEASVAATRSFLPARAELADLVRYATLAPSGHNALPWRFGLAVATGRGIRYFGQGYLAVVYGEHALALVQTYGPEFGIGFAGLVLCAGLATYWFRRQGRAAS